MEAVFPLLCPVKETDWIPGWLPDLVVSNTGTMEKNCIFLEPTAENEAIWVVTGYEKNQYLAMYRILPGVAVSRFILRLDGDGNTTKADVSYEHTSLGEAGDKLISEFTEDNFNVTKMVLINGTDITTFGQGAAVGEIIICTIVKK